MNWDRLRESVKLHEGYREEPYRDSLGVWTVGCGHNINGLQLSAVINYRTLGELLGWISDPQQHHTWLESDLLEAESDARRFVGDDWDRLTDARREVLAEMAFQLGGDRLAGFIKFRAAVLAQNWSLARLEMRDSQWYRQTPTRVDDLAEKLVAG